MVKKKIDSNGRIPIDVRFALKPTKTAWSSKGKTSSTGKIAIFAIAGLLLVSILLAAVALIYIRSKP